MNSRGERAGIDWNPTNNTYRYSTETGDPLGYRPVVEALARQNRFDAGGFATADTWMAATLTNHYPLALERIVRGLTRVTLNPATILISLGNDYVHCGWLIQKGADLSTLQQHSRCAGQPQLGRHRVEQFHAHPGHFERPGGRTV